MSNYKTVFFTLGILLIILGVAMMVPVVFQLIYNEFDSTFITSGIITITFGILFFLSNIDHLKLINTQQAFLLTALSWLSIATFGSLPFFFSELNLSITDSFFESMSGITTTGATILNNIESSPKGILNVEVNASMAWRNWCNFDGYYSYANYEYWWNAIIKNFRL